MSKLMINNQAAVPEQDKTLKQSSPKGSLAPSTEEKEEESHHFERKESRSELKAVESEPKIKTPEPE